MISKEIMENFDTGKLNFWETGEHQPNIEPLAIHTAVTTLSDLRGIKR
jgi:hypothetical protein